MVRIAGYVGCGAILAFGWLMLAPDSNWSWIPFAIVTPGLAALSISARDEPKNALLLLVTINTSFWLWVQLWRRRSGPDDYWFFWLLLLLTLSFYQLVAFARGLKHKETRKTAIVGVVLLIGQLITAVAIHLVMESY